jgi:hypothetical protein
VSPEWAKIETEVTVTDPDTSWFQVCTSGGAGQLWLDEFYVGKACEATVLRASVRN